jgi:hypothetical protein
VAQQKRSQRGGGGGGGAAPAAAAASPQATGDSGDAVMARWLQSTGLQHLAASSAFTGVGAADVRSVGGSGVLPSLLMQVRSSSDSFLACSAWEHRLRNLAVLRVPYPASYYHLLRRGRYFPFVCTGICRDVHMQRCIFSSCFIQIVLQMVLIADLSCSLYCGHHW